MPSEKRFLSNNSAILYLIGFSLYLFASLAVGLLQGEVAIYLGYAIPQLIFVASILGYTYFKKYKLNDLVPITRRKLNLYAVLLCVPITIGMIMQNYLLADGFQWIMTALGAKMSVTIPAMNEPWQIVTAILLLAVIPAIGEESMYRGVWVSGLTNSTSPKTAILLSGLIFSLSHLNPAQLVHQFILGVLLAYISSETESVVYGMIIHFLNNLIALVLPLIFPKMTAVDTYSWQNLLILMGVSVAGVCVLYPSLFAMMKFASAKGNKNIFSYIFTKKKQSEPFQASAEGENPSEKPQSTATKAGFTDRVLGAIGKVGYWTVAVMAILVMLSVISLVVSFNE